MTAETEAPNSALLQKLRRLGLLDEDNHLPEFDATTPVPIQKTYLAPSGTRSVLRLWADSVRLGQRLPATALMLTLDHMRERPAESASMLSSRLGLGLDDALTGCALDTARTLFEEGRTVSNIDLSVNFMLEAQREFMFALSSGRLTSAQRTESLGKYAVAVAFSSRWFRTSAHIVQRAYEYQKRSIGSGNIAPQAFEYLVELLAELFNQTRDERYLDEALRQASERGLHLPEAELLLRRGLLRVARGEQAIPDFQRACELVRVFRPTNGVQYVEAALVREFSLAAILGRRPLRAHEIRFPYGFLLDLSGLAPAVVRELTTIVTDGLTPMREDLQRRGVPPNLVAQQVLSAVYSQALERSGFTDQQAANELVDVTRETASYSADRHLQWRHSEALLARATSATDVELVDETVDFAADLVAAHVSWPLPRVTLARALQLRAYRTGDEPSAVLATEAWRDATNLVVNCPEFRRTDLGGRSGVFAVEDARGDLSTALVFKPVVSAEVGEREASQFALLAQAIEAAQLGDRFGVPRSLGVFPSGPDQHVHVVERHLGRVVATYEQADGAEFLAPCVELLALYHSAADRAAQNQSGWQALKKSATLGTFSVRSA